MARKLTSLRRQSEFARLREAGRRERTGPITLSFCAEGATCALACAIPKRVGNAVVRNRLRRRIRAVFAETDVVVPGMYVVSVAPQAATMKFQELQTVLVTAITKVTQS